MSDKEVVQEIVDIMYERYQKREREYQKKKYDYYDDFELACESSYADGKRMESWEALKDIRDYVRKHGFED